MIRIRTTLLLALLSLSCIAQSVSQGIIGTPATPTVETNSDTASSGAYYRLFHQDNRGTTLDWSSRPLSGGAGLELYDPAFTGNRAFIYTTISGLAVETDQLDVLSPRVGLPAAVFTSSLTKFDHDSMVFDVGADIALISDLKDSPTGLEYFDDYSDILKTKDRSVPDVGTVKKLIAETPGGGGGSPQLLSRIGRNLSISDGNTIELLLADTSAAGGAVRLFTKDNAGAGPNGLFSINGFGDAGIELNSPSSPTASGWMYTGPLGLTFTFPQMRFQGDISANHFFVQEEDVFFTVDSVSLSLSDAGASINDKRLAKKGLEYFGDFSAFLKENDRSVPDVGTVKELIAEDSGGGSGSGDQIDDLIDQIAALTLRVDDLEAANLPVKARFVFIGASILEDFLQVRDLQTELESAYPTAEFDVVNFATSGATTQLKANELAAQLATLPSDDFVTYFVIHIGGNNVTNTRPYSTATPTELTEFTDGLDSIRNSITGAGYPLEQIIINPISWRNYDLDLSAQTDESKGSKPYNDSLISQYQNPLYTYSDSSSYFDLYTFTYNNHPLLIDPVHLSDPGSIALQDHFVGGLAYNIVTSEAPTKLVKNAPSNGSNTEIVVDFSQNSTSGSKSYDTGINRITTTDSGNSTAYVTDSYTGLQDINGTITSVGMVVESSRVNDTDAAGNPGNTTSSIENDDLLSAVIFSGGNVDIVVTLDNLPPDTQVTIKLAASRSGTGGRTQNFLATGATTVTGYDVQDFPVTIATLVGQTNALGELEIRVVATGSAFAYLAGIGLKF